MTDTTFNLDCNETLWQLSFLQDIVNQAYRNGDDIWLNRVKPPSQAKGDRTIILRRSLLRQKCNPIPQACNRSFRSSQNECNRPSGNGGVAPHSALLIS